MNVLVYCNKATEDSVKEYLIELQLAINNGHNILLVGYANELLISKLKAFNLTVIKQSKTIEFKGVKYWYVDNVDYKSVLHTDYTITKETDLKVGKLSTLRRQLSYNY